ncbi:MAG: alanine racemase [Ancrocorticia sp.]|jgi:alanine racemase|nr:alanine racemase [Ancrocorticia sp.]MCI1896441.1 alanine racemase [Ancrocorticia sp.]MCI1933309.1 alanine racemase [Ancrocorticia sp.]MCI2013340.1 alanine racemase [Ancrocorticia sp.]MCI2030097.1 alanine racemase [Ancrocorticia sp.]
MSYYYPARADIDLAAFAHNLNVVRQSLDGQKIMAIVKADAYGHGRVECARTAIAHGADYLGVAQLGEAIELRKELGAGPRILAWIYAPGAPLAEAIRDGVDISVGAWWALDEVEKAAAQVGAPARVHLKVDTGMARGGFPLAEIPDAAQRLQKLERGGDVVVVGLWSHLARADEPGGTFTDVQVERFEEARVAAAKAGLDIELHHLAATAGALWHPKARYDMVRPGIALYGLSPNPAWATARQLGLTAVMTLSGDVIVDRMVPSGTGISYGHTFITDKPMRVGVVPLGYEDGIDRKASNTAPLVINGQPACIVGRVCMDQFVTSLPDGAKPGDTAYLFGDEAAGLPTADDWAEAMGTIGYEVVTRLGARVPRVYHE